MNKKNLTKTIIGTFFCLNILWAIDIPIDEVEKRVFRETVSVNSKVIQLSSSKSLVMAEMGGKIRKYLVKEGDTVKEGEVVAEVSYTSSLETSMQSSLELSPLRVELKALKKRLGIVNKNYVIVKKLYDAGVESQQNLNSQEEEKAKITSKIEVLRAKLLALELRKKPRKSTYTLYAGNAGVIDKILIASNAVVNANMPLLSIVKGEESFLVKSYVPLKYVNEVELGLKGEIFYGGKHYGMHLTQILPELDEQTQQIVVLSTLDVPVKNLFLNTYVSSKLFFGAGKSHLSVKKTALNFFNNEWVVFVPRHHEEHEKEEHSEHGSHTEDVHDEHKGHDHANHKEEEHKSEGEHKDDDVPYAIKVVKILKQNKHYVAIEGLEEHENYASDKSYYIKSMLLKSSLGGHGH